MPTTIVRGHGQSCVNTGAHIGFEIAIIYCQCSFYNAKRSGEAAKRRSRVLFSIRPFLCVCARLQCPNNNLTRAHQDSGDEIPERDVTYIILSVYLLTLIMPSIWNI